MPERFVSPGVYTQETDICFVPTHTGSNFRLDEATNEIDLRYRTPVLGEDIWLITRKGGFKVEKFYSEDFIQKLRNGFEILIL